MAPRKLSDADKHAAVELYKQPGETTSTIADRYGVSNSTISRLLKTMLTEPEYAALRSQKRSGSTDRSTHKSAKPASPKPASPKKAATPKKAASPKKDTAETSAESATTPESPAPDSTPPGKGRRRSRRRSSAPDADQLSLMAPEDEAPNDSVTPLSESSSESAEPVREPVRAPVLKREPAPDPELPTAQGFDDDDGDDLDGDDLDDDDLIDEDDLSNLDDDLDEDDDDEDDDDEDTPQLAAAVQIMPLTDTALPATCYLVIDRLSELITRPLKEFAELAEIPSTEKSARTLPVFDNHRVARRFSRRNQRVIKVPNGQLLTKTQPYLQARGINHLLIDGTLYSLTGE